MTIAADPEALEGLPRVLAALAPELAEGSVGWRIKELADGRTIWIGRCPLEHESGAGTHGDLSAGYDAEGRPYAHCLHTSCTAIPAISSRLREAHRPTRGRPAADAPPIVLTEIAVSMLADLDGGDVALHRAPTGSGKSHAIALVAAERFRRGELTLIALPTVRLAGETAERLRLLIPDAFEADAVATIYGHRPKLDDADDAGDVEEEGADDEGKYPIHEWTKVVVSTHAQLGRRGFSRFLRGIWQKIARQEDRDGNVTRAAFPMIIDEAADFLRQSRHEIATAHRTRLRSEPDRSGGTLDPLKDCPKSNHSGNCANCRWVGHGGAARFNRFQIRELKFPGPIEIDADGQPLRTPRNPLQVEEADVATGERVRVGTTTFAAEVLAWKGRPIRPEARRTASTYIFQHEEGTKHHPHEKPAEVLAHLLEFAHRPVMAWEYPVDAAGRQLEGEALAGRILAKDRAWDDGVTFPGSTCGVARLLLTDLLALEKLRRHAEQEGVGLIFAGATLVTDDVAVLRGGWPGLAEREHPYPDRRIRQVALASPAGPHGIGSLVDPRGRLHPPPGEAGKTVVLIALNAGGLEELLAASPAVVQGSELPPVVAKGGSFRARRPGAAVARGGGSRPAGGTGRGRTRRPASRRRQRGGSPPRPRMRSWRPPRRP